MKKSLFKKYFKALTELKQTAYEYECAKKSYRTFGKYENQTKEYKNISDDYKTPITMMNINDIRNRAESNCRVLKEELKKKELAFNEVCKEIERI